MNSAEAKTAIGGIAIAAIALGGLFLVIGAAVANAGSGSGDAFAGVPQFAIGGALVQLGVVALLFWLHAHAVAPNTQ